MLKQATINIVFFLNSWLGRIIPGFQAVYIIFQDNPKIPGSWSPCPLQQLLKSLLMTDYVTLLRLSSRIHLLDPCCIFLLDLTAIHKVYNVQADDMIHDMSQWLFRYMCQPRHLSSLTWAFTFCPIGNSGSIPCPPTQPPSGWQWLWSDGTDQNKHTWCQKN